MKVLSDLAVDISAVRMVAIVAKPVQSLAGAVAKFHGESPMIGIVILHNGPTIEVSAESARELLDALKQEGGK